MSISKIGNAFNMSENLKDQDSDNNVPSSNSVSEIMSSLKRPSVGTSALGLGIGNTGAMSNALASMKKANEGVAGLGLGIGNTGAMSDALASMKKANEGVASLATARSFSETMSSLNKTSTKNIHKTANDLVKSGKRPTLAAIREELGGGSFTTISEAMKSWREEQEELEQTLATKLPPDLEDKLQVLGVSFWEAANTLATERLSKEYKTLELVQENVIGDLSQAEEVIKRLKQKDNKAEAEIEQLRVANAQLKTDIDKYGKESHNTKQELDKAHSQINEQSEQIKKLLDQQQELINTLTRFSNNKSK